MQGLKIRAGIDLVEIDRLETILPAIRQRFLQRVFTPRELEEAQGANARLAGKFAAKEAVVKALGCGVGPVSWQDIEILHGPAGQPELRLHGNAVSVAGNLGLTGWSISISHDRTHAVALAVALEPDFSSS